MELDDVIQRKTAIIKERLALIKKLLGKVSRREFELPEHHEYAARLIEVIIQAMLDIGNHILAILGKKCVETYRDIFIMLGKEKILPEKFAQKIAPLAGLRNILIHMYDELDLDILWETLHAILHDADMFLYHIFAYLHKENPSRPAHPKR